VTEDDTKLIFCYFQVQIKTAKRRVVMASLYLGTGLLEQELVSVERVWQGEKVNAERKCLPLQKASCSCRYRRCVGGAVCELVTS